MGVNYKLTKKTIQLCLFMVCFCLASSVQAIPRQQIIISFNQPIVSENISVIHKELSELNVKYYSLAESSTNIRWVVTLSSTLDEEEIKIIKEKLSENKLVKDVELDRILQRKAIMTNP